MRIKLKATTIALFVVGASFLIALAPTSMAAANTLPPGRGPAEAKPANHQKDVIAAFNRHVKDYVEQRNRVRKKLTQLSKDATPEQIQAHQKSFVDALIAMRSGTKAGYMFNKEMADYIRTIVKAEFKGAEKTEVRGKLLEAETKGIPLKVNYPYPEQKEITQMPPALLLKLPQLPKEVRYRFVREHLLLVDTDNDLIVDYMLNAFQ